MIPATQLQRAPCGGQKSAVAGEVLGPETKVMQVGVLVSDPDGAWLFLDELDAWVAGRVAHRCGQHEVRPRPVAVAHVVQVHHGSPCDSEQLAKSISRRIRGR